MSPAPLDDDALLAAVDALAGRDPDLAGIVGRHGPPPLWARDPGFDTLVSIILEQQVSLASGAAARHRLLAATTAVEPGAIRPGAISPGAILAAGEQALLTAGITRQKTRYLLALAADVDAGRLDLEAIAAAEDDEARGALTRALGIGRWTADIYLLMALGRPDIWPIGDLALAGSMRRAKRLAALPTADEQLALAAAWRPWRAVGARLLWHAYLAGER
jgi:DNA-3-methyladenine glycosylase II